jgi:calcium-dependent protein kinase
MSQNKTGLTMVFEKLGDVKLPRDEWYVQVFTNFHNGTGLIDLQHFKDIVVQMDDHQQEKKRRKEQALAAQLGTGGAAANRQEGLPPPPPLEGASPSPGRPAQSARPQDATQTAAGPSTPHHAGASDERLSVDDTEMSSALDANRVSTERLPHRPSTSSQTLGGSVTPKTPFTRVGAAEIKADVMFPTYVGRLAIFDDYEFHGDVGQGAFGKVMVVRSKKDPSKVRACKVMAAQNAQSRELIDTEINLLQKMNHPSIVKLYEVYFEEGPDQRVSNGNIYLIFELCEGGDLFGRILHHYQRLNLPMTEGHVSYMMKQILSALAYCHKQDIVHRDIKPENILFVDRSSSSPIKIIDYGLANFTEKIRGTAKEVKVEKTGLEGKIAKMLPTINGRHIIAHHERKKVMQRAGTPHYMAPEMIAGYYDCKADVFSIGIIFCQLLTGWHPFYIPQVDDEASVRKKISDPEPVQFPKDIFSTVSPQATDLCQNLLEKDPANRVSAEEALEHPWIKDPDKPSPYGAKDVLSMSIFEGLMKYQAYNKLKRAVLQLLTRELSEYQIQELRRKFNALDSKGDGLLSPEELMEGTRHVGYEMREEELAKVMAALDGTGSQRIGYKEFISALIERRRKFQREELFACFKKFDTRNTGKISYDDVSKVLQSKNGGSPGITESEWAEIADAMPGNRTSQDKIEISFDEFVVLMQADEG